MAKFPLHRGKGILIDHVIRPILPKSPQTFVAAIGGALIELEYQERIGLSHLLHGSFERAELELAAKHARPGSLAVDAGANVGIFTVPLARAVGSEGCVLAFEPAASNVERLRANLRRNHVDNVIVETAALGAVNGTVELHLGTDPAYHSVDEVERGLSSGESVSVAVRRLDDVWVDRGRPAISFLKIDVEGSELDVLDGAERLLREQRPMVLVEAASDERRAATTRWFEHRAFARVEPSGFLPWNLAFAAAD